MGFTAISNFTTSGAGGATTLPMASAVTVNANDVVIVYAGNDQSQAINSIDDGNGHTATLLSLGSNGTRRHIMGYWLAAPTGGSITYTANFAGSCTNRTIGVWVFTPSAAASLDGATSGPATGTGTAVASNSLTTAGSDCLIIGSCYAVGAGFTSPLIGGAAATASDSDGAGAEWYKATTGSGVTASITVTSGIWIADAMSFQIAAAASSGGRGRAPLLAFQRGSLVRFNG